MIATSIHIYILKESFHSEKVFLGKKIFKTTEITNKDYYYYHFRHITTVL